MLKKFDRSRSAASSYLQFSTPKKANSCFQKMPQGILNRQATDEKPLELNDLDTDDNNEIEITLKKILKPYRLSYVPIDFLEEGFIYHTFIGVIGKQSKILKKIMDRKIKLDVVEGKLIEYRDVFDYPDKPNRVNFYF